jgi:acylpyruvate hydrolase
LKPSKILCIGRNYVEHAKELDNPVPKEPLVFLKPPSALIGDGGTVVLPPASKDVHHEVELVARIGRMASHVSRDDGLTYIDAYAVGLDLTARDLQSIAKTKGHPWSVSKGFDTFSPLGGFVDAMHVQDPHCLDISLHINGKLIQSGNTGDMIFRLPYLISFLSAIFTLEPGDLIYTGTPEGVGPINDGDVMRAELQGAPILQVTARRSSL